MLVQGHSQAPLGLRASRACPDEDKQIMVDLLLTVLLLAFVALAAVAGYWVISNWLGGQSPVVALFGARPEKRLAIVEHASVDGRRRLVLIRRDDVEHLIMTGGPVDVVIETGIGTSTRAAEPAPAPQPREDETGKPVFGRLARNGQRASQPIAE